MENYYILGMVEDIKRNMDNTTHFCERKTFSKKNAIRI